MAKGKKIPFSFVMDYLDTLQPIIKPMFGCHAIYIKEKIVLVLRNREDHPLDNGVWVATGKEHHESLKQDFTDLRSISLFGPKGSSWQVIPMESEEFEEAVIKVCDLITRGDNRIGRIPAIKRKKNELQ